jgi:hypothetical protein
MEKKSRPIVVSDELLRRLVETKGRIEQPATPPKFDAERPTQPATPVKAA